MSSQTFNNIYISEFEGTANSYPIKYSNEIVSYEKLNGELVANIIISNYNNEYNGTSIIFKYYIFI